ncbi:MAG: ISL3 family transposase [Bradymonadaceae bacterium]
MSTSLLYHAFGAFKHTHIKTEYEGGEIYFHAKKRERPRRCPACEERRDFVIHDWEARELKNLPIGGRPTYLVLHLRVFECRQCDQQFQESRQVARPRKSYTKRFEKLVWTLSQSMTLSDVARFLKVGWDLVKGIVKRRLIRRADKRKWKHLTHIAIDEIAIKRGHRYLTVVLDLDSGRVVYVEKGKDHEALEGFFRKLGRAGADLEAIAVDMSTGYRKAIRKYAPDDVAVVHDKYHLVSSMNDTVDAVRRQEQRRLEDEDKQVIKGTRYLLLYGEEKLNEQSPDKIARLKKVLEANELIQKAYLLKEEFRRFWDQPNKRAAKLFLSNWVLKALSVGNQHLTKMAKTVFRHLDRILAWYDYEISTGPLEGLNNKIKVLQRKAFGFRDDEFFQLQILFLHQKERRLIGA